MDMNVCLDNKKRLLMIFTSVCAGVSTVLIVLSVASEHWLNSIELYKGPREDLYFLPENFTGQVYVSMNFGIWRSCQEYIDKSGKVFKETECEVIAFNSETGGEKQDEEDSIQAAIIQNCRKSIIFPLLSMCLEILGDVFCLLGYFFGRRRYLTFVTGVLFVISGMSLLVGCILFMGTVTGEANHQPAAAKDETPAFRYSYGSSFLMLLGSFCLDEVSGVLSVYLFIIRHKESVKRKHARLRAFKSKADQIHNFFKRKSRNQSASSNPSNGDISRRSSYMPIIPEASTYNMNRDTSHMTMMTTVESHNHLNNNVPVNNTQSQIDDTHATKKITIPEIKLHNHCDVIEEDDGSPLVSTLTLLPPEEFQTSDEIADFPPPPPYVSCSNRLTKCKTTSV